MYIGYWTLNKCYYHGAFCVGDEMDMVFSVCIVRRGAIGDRVWEV